MTERHRNILIFSLLILAFGIFPLIVTQYWIRLFTGVFMYVLLAQATNILMGFSGLVPFGNVVFFGIGAYLTGIIMMNWNFPFLLHSFLGQ